MHFIRQQWFLFSLASLMALGFWLCRPLDTLSQSATLKWTVVFITMFLMGWPLKFSGLAGTLTRPLAPALACFMNVVAAPLILWPLLFFFDPATAAGMVLVMASPCTLASATVWTRRAGGDDGVAIMVTIVTNLFCFAVTPMWVYLQTGAQVDDAVLASTVHQLLMFVVAPIFIAQIARLHVASANWASGHKTQLTVVAQIGLLCVIFIGAVQTGNRIFSGESELNLLVLCAAVAVLLLVHSLVLVIGYQTTLRLGCSRESAKAVAFAGSQKTLMVGLSIALILDITILPLVAYNSLQLIVDTVFADRFRSSDS